MAPPAAPHTPRPSEAPAASAPSSGAVDPDVEDAEYPAEWSYDPNDPSKPRASYIAYMKKRQEEYKLLGVIPHSLVTQDASGRDVLRSNAVPNPLHGRKPTLRRQDVHSTRPTTRRSGTPPADRQHPTHREDVDEEPLVFVPDAASAARGAKAIIVTETWNKPRE
ncbi:hypothetical protein ACJ41O_011713 [Fusarium nematophilum]